MVHLLRDYARANVYGILLALMVHHTLILYMDAYGWFQTQLQRQHDSFCHSLLVQLEILKHMLRSLTTKSGQHGKPQVK